MRLRNAVSLVSLVTMALSVSSAGAQVRTTQPGTQPAAQPGVVNPAGQRVQGSGWQSTDQTLATCLSIDNQEEIALAKFVQSKTANDDVKEFAKMLIEDHQSFLKKLEKYSPEAARDSLAAVSSSSQSGVQPAGGTAPQQPGRPIQQTSGTQAQPAGQLDFIQLHRELASQCLADTKEMLSEKSRDELDACFVGLQIAKHAAMATKLTVLQRHASGELAQILKDGKSTVEEHQEHAEKLMKQLAEAKHDSDAKSSKSESKTERKGNRE